VSLSDFDPAHFLANYWQTAPLVIPAAFIDPYWMDPDDLAGLACEDGVESRIIQQMGSRWDVQHGPFDENYFSKLPESNWTLLVQAVDQWIPEVRNILKGFDFLPGWRLDDIMVSFAPVGGTVSQHFDYYDVFLIQGEGSRRWQVGQQCGPESELLPDTPVKILKHFEPTLDIILNPGDMLYVPAGFAHFGVSVQNSLTYSVGLRAPGIREIVDGVATTLLENGLSDDRRYRDTIQSLAAATGEIPAEAIDQIKSMLIESFANDDVIASWFARTVTTNRYSEQNQLEEIAPDFLEQIKNGVVIQKNPSARFAYVGKNPDCLYVNGEAYECSTEMAKLLSDSFDIATVSLIDQLSETNNISLVRELLQAGILILGDEH